MAADEGGRGRLGALRSIWLEPPLAFARIGGSDQPLEAYDWGENDLSPTGSGKTTIMPSPSLVFDEDGGLQIVRPEIVMFRDAQGMRPVCPFFELHGEWEGEDGVRTGLVPESILPARALVWHVHVANLKAFNLTLDAGTRIEAQHRIEGGFYEEVVLEGRSPSGVNQPLVPPGRYIPLGRARLSRPTMEVGGYRLRFYPAKGLFFSAKETLVRWPVRIPEHCQILSPDSPWSRWRYDENPPRATPQAQYAADETGVSYGIVDDMCDGMISCSVIGLACAPARARIVVGPPDYAPDRRPIVSLADGLKDRVDRAETAEPGYYDDIDLAEREVEDLLERILETASLMNLDALADFHRDCNPRIAAVQGLPYEPDSLFADSSETLEAGLPLTQSGRRAHRRLAVGCVASDFFRRRPELLRSLIRPPDDPNPIYDHRMPALMHGSDSKPLTLSHRQYALLMSWAARLGGDVA